MPSWLDYTATHFFGTVPKRVDQRVECVNICSLADYREKEGPLYDVGSTPFGDGILDVQDLIALDERIS